MLAMSARNAAPPTSSSGVTSARARGRRDRPARAPPARAGRRSGRAGPAARRPKSRLAATRVQDRRAAPASSGNAVPGARDRRPRPDRRRRRPRPPAADRAPAHGQAARVVSRKARPCAVVSRMPLLRRRERGGQLGHRAQRRVVAAGRRAVGVDEEHRVAEAAALADHHREPALQRRGIGDVAGLHRPFDAARIGECADRIGRRQPRHQPIERGASRPAPARLRDAGLRGRSGRDSCRRDRRSCSVPCMPAVGAAASGSNGASIGGQRRAEAAQHVLEHMVAADAQPVADDLHVGVAVAECQASRARSCAAAGGDLDQRLGLAGRPARSSRRRAPGRRRRAAASACGRSSRKVVPLSPVSTIRRRWRSSASSTTRSIAAAVPPAAGRLDLGCASLHRQNRKYRCAIGSTSAGAQVSSSPSARDLVGFRIDLDVGRRAVVDHALLGDVAAGVLDRDQLLLDAELVAQARALTAAFDTNTTDDAVSALPKAPNIGR